MKDAVHWLLVVFLAVIAGGAAGFAAGTWQGAEQASTSDRIVRDYILAHPEVLTQAMDRLQARSAAKAITAEQATLTRPFAGAWAGNPDGDVTLVMFSDYSCGYCKASTPEIERLLREDRKLKVVWREMPVLGPQSEVAARAGLAAAQQGRYWPFHRALFANGHPDERVIMEAAGKARLDAARLSRDMSSAAVTREIEDNLALAGRLGIGGTPAFVVGDRLLPGAVGLDALRAAISDARQG